MAANYTSPGQFAVGLCQAMGWPVTQSNVAAIIAWAQREGGNWGNSAHFNPLNTTQSLNGSTSMNSVNVQAFKSWDDGLAATAQTLRNGRYADILAAFASGDASKNLVNASAGLTTWSGGGYGSIAPLIAQAQAPASAAIAGAPASTPGAAAAPAGVDPANVDQLIRQNYGYEAWALDVPELKAALTKALSDHGANLDQATLEGYIKGTNWWQVHTTAQRNYQQLVGEDPGTASASIATAVQSVNDLVTRYGLNVPPDRVNQIATDSVTNNWSPQQLNDAMVSEAMRETGGDATQGSQPSLPTLPDGEVFVDEVTSPFGGSYGLTNKGGVYTLNGAKFYGSYLGYAATTANPEKERAQYGTFAKGGLTVNPDGTYTLHNTAGNPYYFGPGVPGGVAGATLQTPIGTQPVAPGGAFKGGELASNFAKVQALAKEYFINIDPASAQKMAIQLTGGQLTDTAVQGTIIQQALQKYAGDPTTTAGINAGFSVKQLATDQINSMAKLLGVTADSIDLQNPKWSQVLNFRDPATGTTRMMNTGETENLVRNSPDWDHTADANATASTALKAVMSDMGKAKF